MLDNPVWRTALIAISGMGVTTVLSLMLLLMIQFGQAEPIETKASSSDGIQLVDGDCANKLVLLEAEILELTVKIDEEKALVRSANELRLSELGEAVAQPDEVPAHQSKEGFRSAMAKSADKRPEISLLSVVCEAYPCVAVFSGDRADFVNGLRRPAREFGFRWTQLWQASAVSTHTDGETHFTAIRFFPKKGLNQAQTRYLERGLERALVQVLDTTDVVDD